MAEQGKAFEKLVEVVDELRVKCPWDRKQTLSSLRSLTIEETYELAEAIEQENLEEIKKELGDLLLHVVFYAKIGKEKKAFDIRDVCEGIVQKLIDRHPHVYGETEADTEEKVKANWEKLKKKEKKENASLLDGVPGGLPSLVKAMRIQDKAAATGFDWEKTADVWEKVKEEVGELDHNLKEDMPVEKKEDELGDLIFSLINLARFEGLDPDKALNKTNRKFIERFKWMEAKAGKKGVSLKELDIDEMEKMWQEAKKEGSPKP